MGRRKHRLSPGMEQLATRARESTATASQPTTALTTAQSTLPALRPSGKPTKLAKAQQRAAGEREAAKIVLLHHVGAKVCSNLNAFAFPDPGGDLASTFLAALLASVQPRDLIEEMLVVQMAFTHARLAYLSRLAADQEQRVNITAVNQACEQASNTFRRQMLALSDYRRVPK